MISPSTTSVGALAAVGPDDAGVVFPTFTRTCRGPNKSPIAADDNRRPATPAAAPAASVRTGGMNRANPTAAETNPGITSNTAPSSPTRDRVR